jgi:hypothetical protein
MKVIEGGRYPLEKSMTVTVRGKAAIYYVGRLADTTG